MLRLHLSWGRSGRGLYLRKRKESLISEMINSGCFIPTIFASQNSTQWKDQIQRFLSLVAGKGASPVECISPGPQKQPPKVRPPEPCLPQQDCMGTNETLSGVTHHPTSTWWGGGAGVIFKLYNFHYFCIPQKILKIKLNY